MPFKVEVGPPQIAIHQAHTVLVTDPDGQVMSPSDKGLYFFDTRLISAWAIYANGEPWDLLNGGGITYHAARILLLNRAFLTEDGAVPASSLSFMLGRAIGGGMHEDLDITNYGSKTVRFNLELVIRSDFADIFEVRTGKTVHRARIITEWLQDKQELSARYTHDDFIRAVRITARAEQARAVCANGRLCFEVTIEPRRTWHCCLLYELTDGHRQFAAPQECLTRAGESILTESLTVWRRTVLKIRTSNEEFYRFYHQSVSDMAALRLPIGDMDHMVFVPAAGVPWFLVPFGRDSLIVSLQNLLVYPDFARGALEVLGSLQAKERDDYRDAEPGKIPHELRYGELAHFKTIPHTPYYGTADATPLYLIVLHAGWRATGDRALLERHLPTAEACLDWIDNWGDRDGDGFQEYQTRSAVGYENMGWKDARDAVLNPDGTPVKGPKALCELQGYVYDAWLRMAEVYDELGQPDRARELRDKAATLFRRFNEAFWDEATGFYALALDGEKRQVLSVASNPGHCLWSGLVPPERAARVVARLLAPDMSSGWGIRTLSALHPAYNPHSYHNGSVWPHDNSIIAAGFRRYGFVAEAAAIAHDICDAASHFLLNQLPELYAGIPRDVTGFPVQALGANVPQAWAAGSAFALLQSMLGILPDAPRGILYVDPHLPDWLTDITLIDLRMGRHSLDIRFWRDGLVTQFDVLRGDASMVQVRNVALASERLRNGRDPQSDRGA